MSTASAAERAAPSFDFANLVGRYRRHAPLVAGVLAVVLTADVVFTWTQTPYYTSTNIVYYSPRATDLSSHGGTAVAQDQARDQAVDTQVEVIKSSLVADAVVNQLHLDRDPEFISPKSATRYSPDLERDALIDRVIKRLRVKRVGQTLLVGIAYSDKSPVKAARMANAFAEAFIAHDLQQKLSGSRDANVLLNAQIDDMRQKVEAAEAALQTYKAENGLLGADGPSNTVAQQNITLLNQQYAQVRSDAAQAEARLLAAQKQLHSDSKGDEIGDALDSPSMVQLRGKRSELSAKVADLRARYGPMHPDLKNAEAQLRDTDREIRGEIDRIVSNLSAQVEVARGKEASIDASLAQARGQLAQGANASVKMNELQRNADAARQLYENVLAKVKETSVQQAVSQSDSHVDTPATPSSQPSSPNKPLNILLGLFVGLGLGVIAAYVRERWNAQLSSLEDVEGLLGLPYLGSIPTLASAIDKPETRLPADAVCMHPLSSFAESFRGLSTTLKHGGNSNAVKVIGITSALPGEGKTVTTLSLARVEAKGGARVILLDCDLRRRTAYAMLGKDATFGLVEVIEGKASLDDVIQVDELSGAHYIPLTKESLHAQSPFTNPNFDAVLATLRDRYDYIFLDTPPLLPVVDTRVIAQKVDVLALLVRWRSTPIGAVKTALHHLDAVNAPIVGVALSQVNLKAQAYGGYSYPSYYNKEFDKYYHQS